ncbi:MAG: hypothetical protein ACTTHI_04820 [Prevotella sp.]
MKKFFYLMMAFAVTASILTSCEDIPSPYDNPNNKKQEVTPAEAKGSGTEADPYNVAALNAHLKSLKADVNTEEIFVKGKIVSIKELQTSGYGNATYYISDDGTTTGQLTIFRSLDLENKKFTDANAIKAGDEVIIRGQFVNYKGNTPETVANKSYLYSINGKKQHETAPTPPSVKTGSGTETDPYNVAAMVAHLTSLKADSATAETFVKGKIVSIKELQTSGYGNATYYISDDGTTTGQLTIFRSLDLENKKFTDANAIKAGDEVIIRGQFVNYKGNTPETVANKSYLYSINGKKQHETTPTPNPPAPSTEALVISGNTVTLNNTTAVAGTETLTVDLSAIGLTEKSDLSNIALSDGSVLSFSANGQTAVPKFFAKSKGVRVYVNNSFTIKGKKAIAKIVITCDVFQETNQTGNPTATVSFTGNDVTYTNTLAGATKAGIQLRIQTLTITYVQ